MKDSLHTLLYAVVLGLICATALTAVDRFTADRKEANAKAEKIRNILGVLGVPFNSDASSEDLVKIYNDNVSEKPLGKLTTYVYRSSSGNSDVEAVAVPFAGPGLWGPIKGFLALDMDKETIVGITFYQQEETPGLGGEIVSPSFRRQFEGKTIRDIKGNPGILIRRGGAKYPNGVNAMTGATMTCDKVEAMLNIVINRIVQERDKHGR
ncbi:hypothetical protein LCGC14_2270000 [marine sediment metagenome]|uniref:FMN-binding domain-containing protein n=1 Tax=marine sediment metagenome TaxID=412755 RepID=A0A0F9CXK2_9ZZZZ